MHPRKKESKKWTKLPVDFSNQIRDVFEQSFKGHLTNRKLQVEGRIYPTEILLRVGFNQSGELRYHNFEVSLEHSKEKQDTLPQIHLGVDAIASLMAEYFEDEENHEMPLVWQEYPFEKQKIWLQYTSVNQDIEAEANRLLGLTDDQELLNESEDLADEVGAEIEVEIESEELNLNDEAQSDDEIDLSQPQIFGGKKKKENLH